MNHKITTVKSNNTSKLGISNRQIKNQYYQSKLTSIYFSSLLLKAIANSIFLNERYPLCQKNDSHGNLPHLSSLQDDPDLAPCFLEFAPSCDYKIAVSNEHGLASETNSLPG